MESEKKNEIVNIVTGVFWEDGKLFCTQREGEIGPDGTLVRIGNEEKKVLVVSSLSC